MTLCLALIYVAALCFMLGAFYESSTFPPRTKEDFLEVLAAILWPVTVIYLVVRAIRRKRHAQN